MPGVQARYTPGNAWEHLTFNLDNPILADPNVRQAIAFGLNRPALNEAILFSKGEVAVSQVPSWSWAYDTGLPHYDFNPSQAELLLEHAGWVRSGGDGIRSKNGKRLSWPKNLHQRKRENSDSRLLMARSTMSMGQLMRFAPPSLHC